MTLHFQVKDFDSTSYKAAMKTVRSLIQEDADPVAKAKEVGVSFGVSESDLPNEAHLTAFMVALAGELVKSSSTAATPEIVERVKKALQSIKKPVKTEPKRVRYQRVSEEDYKKAESIIKAANGNKTRANLSKEVAEALKITEKKAYGIVYYLNNKGIV